MGHRLYEQIARQVYLCQLPSQLYPDDLVPPSKIWYYILILSYQHRYSVFHPFFPCYLFHSFFSFLFASPVVIDEEVAFVGGLDLCYNRYDDSRYLLADPNGKTFPGR